MLNRKQQKSDQQKNEDIDQNNKKREQSEAQKNADPSERKSGVSSEGQNPEIKEKRGYRDFDAGISQP